MIRRLAGGLAAAWAGLTLGLCAAPASAAPVQAAHMQAELVSETRAIAPGQTVWLAVGQKIERGWHTYWRNPGDAGEPTRLAWTLPAGWKAGEIAWPAPNRLPVGPLMDYGYQGEVLLPVALTAPAAAQPGSTAKLGVVADMLVCAETCVPTQAALDLDLPVVAAPAPKDSQAAPKIARALAATPQRAELSAVFQRGPDGVALAVIGPAVKAADKAYFYPYASTAIVHARPQAVEQGPDGLTLTLSPGFDFTRGQPPATLAGVLVVDGHAMEIAATPGAPPAGASGLGPPAPRAAGLQLLPAAVLAFFGGLLLNLMPCVFPVLAMKAANLAERASERAAARRHGLAFGAGVLAAFWGLVGALLALKAAGTAVGWGFQLQSPPIVAGLSLLMLAVALNLSGVFHTGTSVQGVGQGAASRAGLAGAFFTGALSVVVAAPCTAPLMGPAVGWALVQSPAAALTVFTAVAAGFALPFVLVAFAPRLLARLPRPGPWMEALKKLLAFPMYAAAAWLAWVLTVQAGNGALARLMACAVALGLGAWLWGSAQRRRALGAPAFGLSVAGLLVGLAAIASALAAPYAAVAPAAARESEPSGLVAQPYSRSRLTELRSQGRAVFVNYTAAWCVTCQVNDRVALSTPKVAQAFEKEGVVYLKADWTRRDPVIAADLARFGRAAVPLYLFYPAGGGTPQVLPSLLSEKAVLQAVQADRRNGMMGA